jgi:hypothetical protein
MMSLRETGDGLVIAYPLWIGLLFLAFGIALAVYVARSFEWKVILWIMWCAGATEARSGVVSTFARTFGQTLD